jgi:hypothetical protein
MIVLGADQPGVPRFHTVWNSNIRNGWPDPAHDILRMRAQRVGEIWYPKTSGAPVRYELYFTADAWPEGRALQEETWETGQWWVMAAGTRGREAFYRRARPVEVRTEPAPAPTLDLDLMARAWAEIPMTLSRAHPIPGEFGAVEALLAYQGLTYEEVKWVEQATYAAAKSADDGTPILTRVYRAMPSLWDRYGVQSGLDLEYVEQGTSNMPILDGPYRDVQLAVRSALRTWSRLLGRELPESYRRWMPES